MELSTWQGTVYLKLDPSTQPPSKAVFAKHLQRTLDSSSSSSTNLPRTSSLRPRPELEGDGPLPDLPEGKEEPWLDEATKHQWVRFESGGKKEGGKKEDLLYVYTGTVGMMSRYVLTPAASRPTGILFFS